MDADTRERLEIAARAAVELKSRQYADDPWLWATEQVKTKDEATQKLLPFPDKEYVKDMFHCLNTESMIAIPKSRRMFASWGVSTWLLHRIRFHPYVAAYWQSLQESRAAFVVDQRMKFVEDNLPVIYRKEYTAIKTKSGLVGKLEFKDTGSSVFAIPQGDDQIRSYTPSILVMDECDFQPESYSALKGALATVEKNAKIILISTSDGPGKPLSDICREVGLVRFQ